MDRKVFINYIYDSSYSIEFGDYLLVFDYAKGILDLSESKNIIFFVSSKNSDHFTSEIFNIPELKSVKYIINSDLMSLKKDNNIIYLNKDQLSMRDLKKIYRSNQVTILGPGEDINVEINEDHLGIRTIGFDKKSLGYLIDIGPLRIFYGGALDFDKVEGYAFENLIYELREEEADIIFLPIDQESKKSSRYYDRIFGEIDSQIFFPCRIGGVEKESIDFSKKYSVYDIDIRKIIKANERIELDLDY